MKIKKRFLRIIKRYKISRTLRKSEILYENKKMAFCMGKYWSCDPKLGINPTIPITINCFENANPFEYTTFFYDELKLKNPSKNFDIDMALVDHLVKNNITHLFVCFNLPSHASYPSIMVLKYIKKLTNIKIIMLWADFIHGLSRFAQEFDNVSHLQVVLDAPSAVLPLQNSGKNYIPLWSPQDERVFYNGKNILDREIDVCFVGTSYKNRELLLRKLRNLGLKGKYKVRLSGKCNNEYLSISEYAEIFRNSKISVNFSLSASNIHQSKGRIFETMLCGSMLLESDNPETSFWLEPNKDYATFDANDSDDMINKIKYYLENPEEMCKIANNGYKTVNAKYNATNFWNKILNHPNIIS